MSKKKIKKAENFHGYPGFENERHCVPLVAYNLRNLSMPQALYSLPCFKISPWQVKTFVSQMIFSRQTWNVAIQPTSFQEQSRARCSLRSTLGEAAQFVVWRIERLTRYEISVSSLYSRRLPPLFTPLRRGTSWPWCWLRLRWLQKQLSLCWQKGIWWLYRSNAEHDLCWWYHVVLGAHMVVTIYFTFRHVFLKFSICT